uniref:Essential protein Yae1 N-terminal domain-containing protein n=1 Tax=Schistocephalus solidus TaxID=70667 RepID=A0A0X3PAA7_SCHSO
MSADDDFLERIFLAEQTYYSEAYRAGLDLTSKDVPSSNVDSSPLDRQPELDAAWARGVQFGAELGSELYSYLGLANQVISMSTTSSTASRPSERHVELAQTILALLTQSPGLLQFPCAALVKRSDFEMEIARIRAKARQLLSLLGVNTISRKMDTLTF